MKNRWIKALVSAARNAFSAIGVFWTGMEIWEHYFPDSAEPVRGNVWIMIGIALVTAFITFIKKVKPRVVYTIYGKEIVVKPGNIILEKDGAIVVGVNNQMETRMECLAENSIHQQLVRKYGQREFDQIFSQVSAADEKLPFFGGAIGKKRFVFLRMSDVEEGVASTTKQQLGQALELLFANQIKIDILNHKAYFPVLGTGGGGIGLSKQEMIKFEIEAFLDFQRHKNDKSIDRIQRMTIIVYWKDANQIDWKELDTWLGTYKCYCAGCERAKTAVFHWE